MSNPNSVPVLDLEAFDQSPLSLAFQCEYYTDAGLPTGTYLDLTNKVLTIRIAGNFKTPLVLTSAAPTENGSQIIIGDDPTIGKFDLFLADEDLALATESIGHWRCQYLATGETDPVILMRGSFRIISLDTGGSI